MLGFFLVVNANVQRAHGALGGVGGAGGVSSRDDATPAQVEGDRRSWSTRSGLAAAQSVRHRRQTAAARFRQDFPELGRTGRQLERNPFPASFDVRLTPDVRRPGTPSTRSPTTLGVAAGRRRRALRPPLAGPAERRDHASCAAIGLVIVVLLALASALTVANVVRLAAHARREEIEIMQLVGAPLDLRARARSSLEGVLQGGAGALVAIVASERRCSPLGRARYGASVSEAVGLGAITFLPVELSLILLFGGMLLGCLGG